LTNPTTRKNKFSEICAVQIHSPGVSTSSLLASVKEFAKRLVTQHVVTVQISPIHCQRSNP